MALKGEVMKTNFVSSLQLDIVMLATIRNPLFLFSVCLGFHFYVPLLLFLAFLFIFLLHPSLQTLFLCILFDSIMGLFSRLFASSSTTTKENNGRELGQVSFAKKRLQKELHSISRDPPSHCSGGPLGKNILIWKGAIIGPSDSPFEGGVFYLSVQFPTDYPMNPPEIKFETKVYHPNIDFFGNINIDILKHNWSPVLTTPKLLISICSFLTDPNPENPFNPIANLYCNDRKKYEEIAKEWTRKYAMG